MDSIFYASTITSFIGMGSLREFLLYLSFFFLTAWYWSNVAFFEKVKQLAWNFLQSLLCKLGGVISKFTERNELHDVCLHVFLISFRVERLRVSVESVHACETVASHAHDNNTHREDTASDDLVNRLLHVINDSISDDQ